MVAWFGPSTEDMERLRSAVESLGTTSVPGLAAALAWRERRTEKVLARELARADTPIAYEPARRTVRWTKSPPPAPPPEAPAVVPSAPLNLSRPPPLLTPTQIGSGFKTLCPTCHVALIPAGSGNLAVCPQCGRLASVHAAGPVTLPASPSAPPVPSASAEAGGPPASLNDRRSQEMFAAYVSNRPLSCPKCRTPLKHRAVSEYACPACGQSVRFPKAAAPSPPMAPPPPPA